MKLVYYDPPFFKEKTFRPYKSAGYDDKGISTKVTSNLVMSFPVKDSKKQYLQWLYNLIEATYPKIKQDGAFYLHLDKTANHYAKVMSDSVFGEQNFVEQIVWQRKHAQGNGALSNFTDFIVIYKLPKHKLKRVTKPVSADYIKHRFRKDEGGYYRDSGLIRTEGVTNFKHDESLQFEFCGFKPQGRQFWMLSLQSLEKLKQQGLIGISQNGIPYKKLYHSMEVGISNLWTDLSSLHSRQKEWLEFPTQKPQKLMERIIHISSDEGDIVYDGFMGSGTTARACINTNRQYIGSELSKENFDLATGSLPHTLLNERISND